MDRTQQIDKLNSFLRGEISAVETLKAALKKVTRPEVQIALGQCQTSHEERVRRLNARILEMGGKPATDSGVWGAFAKLLEGGAKIFGERAAIAAIEEGEDHGRDDYRRGLDQFLGTDLRSFVEDLLARQLQTHQIVSGLKHLEARTVP